MVTLEERLDGTRLEGEELRNKVSKVWFAPVEDNPSKEDVAQKTLELYQAANFRSILEEGDLVAMKMHFGEKNNTGYIKPDYLHPLIKALKDAGVKPYLTDANTLYRGERSNSVDHLMQAYAHGFGPENMGIPVIIADGIRSKSYEEVPIDGVHFKSVKIANDILHSDVLFVLSHATGHGGTGLGAAIKNIGMGSASRSGKQNQHSDVKPRILREVCRACRLCIKWCPVDAISMVDGKAEIDESICYGCAECTATCQFGAIEVNWEGTSRALQEKMAEYAWGAVKDKRDKIACFTYLIHVTKLCDCIGRAQPAVIRDVGILASYDPVAIDQAAVDLLAEAANKDLFYDMWPENDYNAQLDHAERMGMGSRRYELITIGD
ncbi:MAG: DUF362 domain-containing protein [Firmicutes bacterium]|nr:DUF362 domain-containing protein [Bacillota bacterium]